MRKKLRQQTGETLVETLVALLISTLSVMMLTSAITAAARINKNTRDADARFEEELSIAEGYTNQILSDPDNPTVDYVNMEVKFDYDDSLTDTTRQIEVFGKEAGGILSYKPKYIAPVPPGGGGGP